VAVVAAITLLAVAAQVDLGQAQLLPSQLERPIQLLLAVAVPLERQTLIPVELVAVLSLVLLLQMVVVRVLDMVAKEEQAGLAAAALEHHQLLVEQVIHHLLHHHKGTMVVLEALAGLALCMPEEEVVVLVKLEQHLQIIQVTQKAEMARHQPFLVQA
jgi:hypothetical protein